MANFPYSYKEPFLEAVDFRRFSVSFAEIVQSKIPTSQSVKFYLDQTELQAEFGESEKTDAILKYIELQDEADFAISYIDSIIFSIPVTTAQKVLVLVDDLDPLVVRRFGEDWLAEIRLKLVSDFILLKQARTDMETGLFNSSNLHYLLGSLTDYEQVRLVFISLTPQMRNPLQSINHARKAANLLQGFLGETTPLHHLGQSLFAFVPVQYDDVLIGNISSSLITFLKREGFKKIHIGMSRGRGVNSSADSSKREQLVDQTWTALETAVSRGPFSFCDYESLAYPERHPLNRPDEKLYRFFRNRWRGADRFCLVRFVPTGDRSIQELFEYLGGKGLQDMKVAEDGLYLYLDTLSPSAAKQQVAYYLNSFAEKMQCDKSCYSAGVAPFPYCKFTKSDTIINSKKACIHGEFFGPGALVVFDQVSLNISGDVYYGEGDMKSAEREYRHGLDCAPYDVNLLNSLGVTLAFMNHHLRGQNCFRKALKIEPNNFMALYNFGLGEERGGKLQSALNYYEQALSAHTENDGPEILAELEFNLGRLCCKTGKNKEAAGYLEKVLKKVKGQVEGNRLPPLLGKAYFGIGENKKAIQWLQRALQINEFDTESLSLLGQLYFKEKQGHDIALSLCEKSVDLEPHNRNSLLSLATVQLACGQHEKAIVHLRKCIRYKKVYRSASRQMEKYYKLTGDKKKAEYWRKRYSNRIVS